MCIYRSSQVTFIGCNVSFNIYLFCGNIMLAKRGVPPLNRSKPMDALRILNQGTQTDPAQNQLIWTQVDENYNSPHILKQGCINCAILVSGIGARGVSSEHVEKMEMFSCSTT